MAAVGVEEALIAELGDRGGVAARLEAVGALWEELAAEGLHEDLVGVGESAFHLVIDDAVVAQAPVLCLLEVPALLLEDARPPVDGRMQNGV